MMNAVGFCCETHDISSPATVPLSKNAPMMRGPKYSRASQVNIHLEMANRKLSLRVADNGRGFEQDEAFSEVGGHFGLLGMRERAERLGGELRLHSEPGQGTEVAVTVPIS